MGLVNSLCALLIASLFLVNLSSHDILTKSLSREISQLEEEDNYLKNTTELIKHFGKEQKNNPFELNFSSILKKDVSTKCKSSKLAYHCNIKINLQTYENIIIK